MIFPPTEIISFLQKANRKTLSQCLDLLEGVSRTFDDRLAARDFSSTMEVMEGGSLKFPVFLLSCRDTCFQDLDVMVEAEPVVRWAPLKFDSS